MIIFCASDAGPAEYLCIVANSIKTPFVCVSTEISKPTFDKYSLPSLDFNEDHFNDEVSLVICGSTLENDSAEFKFFAWANQESITSILAIDHWTNFDLRIKNFKKRTFPNQIWVNDKWSKQVLQEMGVEDNLIKVVGNPVLEKIKQIKSNPSTYFSEVIFISEEMKSAEIDLKPSYGYDEFEVLDSLLENKPTDLVLYIKPHPSELKDKYQAYLKESNNVRFLDIDKENLPLSSCYIGMNSILLLELAMQGRKVYSYRPNSKNEFIGNQLEMTYKLKDNELIELMNTRKHLNFKINYPEFKDSLKRILAQIKLYH
tara:strand:+ start:189 stop:1136 length:948 start_codon:yes stop_codon:yes gene_type:complete